MTKHTKILLLLVLAVGLLLRLYNLSHVPVELFGDEIDVGLQANSILKTGRDYNGNFLPVMFESFDEHRLPFLIYWSVPFIKIFGLSPLGVRLPAVVLGLFSLGAFFFLVRHLYQDKIALLSTLLLSLSPWHIQFSRWSSDNIGVLVFIPLGLLFFLKGLSRPKLFIFSSLAFGLGIYSYATTILIIPAIFILLVLLFRKELLSIPKSLFLFPVITGILVISPYLYTMATGKSGERFSRISVLSDSTLNHELINRRVDSTSPLTRYFRNKPLTFAHEITNNYLRSFSTEFLFFQGDPILRHSVGDMGELYLFELLTVILGLIVLVRARPSPNTWLILGLLLISPLPSALTKDGGNHAGRLIVMLLPLTIISALGVNYVFSIKGKLKKLIVIPILILAFGNFSKYLYRYYIEWPRDSWRFWQYGYKEVITYLKTNDHQYKRVFVNNTYEFSLPRFLFWYDFDPATFQAAYKGREIKENIVPGFNGFKLTDKYYFGIVGKIVKDEGFSELLGPEDVYMASNRDEIGTGDWTNSPTKNVIIQKTVVSPTNQPIFTILTLR